jgi:hypothetical protein
MQCRKECENEGGREEFLNKGKKDKIKTKRNFVKTADRGV